MRLFRKGNKVYYLYFGAFDGIKFISKRKRPNYREFESNINIIVGKIETNKHPFFNDKKTVTYVFFFFKFGYTKN